jgi:flagellar FliL protein
VADTPSRNVKDGGLVASIFVVAIITGLAVGAGVATAWYIQQFKPLGDGPAAVVTPGPLLDPSVVARVVPPIIANLAGPRKAWIRIEFSVLLPPDLAKSDELANVIAQDTLAYVRTVPLDYIDSALGLAFLREDLEERVQIRTQGKSRGVLFRTLVVE